MDIQLHEFSNSVLGHLTDPAAVNARKEFWYPQERELGRTQSQCECCGEAKYLAIGASNGTPTSRLPGGSYVNISTEHKYSDTSANE